MGLTTQNNVLVLRLVCVQLGLFFHCNAVQRTLLKNICTNICLLHVVLIVIYYMLLLLSQDISSHCEVLTNDTDA